MKRKYKNSAQTFLEYAMLVSVVVAVLISLTPLLRRGVQGMIRVVSDQVGNQSGAEQPGGLDGHLVEQIIDVDQASVRRRREDFGETRVDYDGTVSQTVTTTTTNLGFQYRDN
jgi:hypothetical protein